MTKALQERVLITANIDCPHTRFVCVRYGNVLASRGSVIPLFHEQIRNGGPVTITTREMTRFLLSLDDAVDIVFAAVRDAHRGETLIPRVPSAKVTDIAQVLIGERKIDLTITGIRPGEKTHEILISEEEAYRTIERGKYYAVQPMLPELLSAEDIQAHPLNGEYSSADDVMNLDGVRALLSQHQLLLEQAAPGASETELLR
jgi:UDP-glucose 4-epimerase